jgi:hypothetical protein
VRAYLAPTFFFDARLMIWHLTLKAGPGEPADAERWLDEQDLIALVKLADQDGDQEFLQVPAGPDRAPAPLAQGIAFRMDGTGGLDLDGLLGAVAAAARRREPEAPLPRRVSRARAATVEVLGPARTW